MMYENGSNSAPFFLPVVTPLCVRRRAERAILLLLAVLLHPKSGHAAPLGCKRAKRAYSGERETTFLDGHQSIICSARGAPQTLLRRLGSRQSVSHLAMEHFNIQPGISVSRKGATSRGSPYVEACFYTTETLVKAVRPQVRLQHPQK